MTKLTTIQTALLTCAARRGDGSLLPLPEGTGPISAGIRSCIAALIKRSLAHEIAVGDPDQSWRRDGEQLFGASITADGRTAVGIEQAPASANDVAPVSPEPTDGLPEPVARQTKSALVLSLLRRDDGATLPELVAATGWLPHTTRAALTGLRKKGHAIGKGKRGDATCYCIGVAA